MYPAGILRFCPPGLAVALILGILSPLAHPSLQPSLAPCLLLSLSLSPPFHPPTLRRGLPIYISTPSLLLLLGTSLRPHADRDVTRPARGRIQTSAPSSFLNSLRNRSLTRTRPEKKVRRLKGSALSSTRRMIILEIILPSSIRIYECTSDPSSR